MMSRCARPECGKTVYPLEELKCLDKVWHKICFKCAVCGMTLSMKNYKGYNKVPYCEPHYPKTVATVVGDTPEMRRLAENTKIQSQAHYHAEFEKMKGTKITVADDPETQRHRQNTKVVSQVEYHNEGEKRQEQEKHRPPLEESLNRVQPNNRAVGSLDDYDPLNGHWGSVGQSNVRQQLNAKLPQQLQHHQSQMAAQAQAQAQQSYQENKEWRLGVFEAPVSPPQAGRGPRPPSAGPRYRAMYDYTAADTDEVSFQEGDIVLDAQFVDEGWMTGTIQRTKGWGMLPANYVEKVM